MRKLPLWMALATVLGVSSAAAQVYPSRTVKIVVPVPPHIRDGRLRVLATSSERRIPEFPDVPAVAEMYPDVVYTSWFAIVAPPKTPSEIANRVSVAIAEVLRMPDVVARLQAMSTTPGGQPPAESARLFAEERERWGKVIALAGIKAQ